MMYHQAMTGCERSHSSKIIIETAIFQFCEPHCDLDLSDSKSKAICSCATLGHNAALQYHVLLHKVQQFLKILYGQILTEILNLQCDHDLEHSNPLFSLDTLAYNVYHLPKIYHPSLTANHY